MDSNSTLTNSDDSSWKHWLLRLFALCDPRSFSDLSTTGSSSKDSDSIQSYRYRYDVFISFRGADTRNTFVDHLYNHLVRKGLFVFKDDKSLQKGESISPQLLQAIQRSQVSIVVFSKDYATSTWCLDEMAAIVECRAKSNYTVFPVFYDVDPSHVRKQNGVYKNAFVLHTKTFKHDPHKVDGWKRAMTCLAESAGWDVRDGLEYCVIEGIVQAVIGKLDHKFSRSADDLIGIQRRVQALENLLKLSSDDDGCQVLGIWGMDGIGKTTLANVLYDTISHHYQFDACCFIEDVSKVYRDGGAIAVQKQILHQTIKEKNLEGYSPSKISGIITTRLHKLKLLLVLDNVDQSVQLQELHINPKVLCAGSRIIITTRDEHILKEYGADKVYEAELMSNNDAHKLLCRKAFKSDNPSSSCAKLIPEVLNYAQGLPLAIRVMGSFLYDRNCTQWRAALEGWKNDLDSGIMKVLRSSFEGLALNEREIFLHVACFFDGEREDYVRRILHACRLQPDLGISLIAEKSFITIRNQEIHMHKMLQELGKQIVRQQHPDEPRLWSRLWLYSDFYDAMITKSEAIKSKAIILNQKEDVRKFNQLRAEDLSKMENLEVLIIYQCHSNFSGRPTFLSNSLRYLLWNGYPFMSLPSDFQPFRLIELNMPDSSFEQLWIGIKSFPYLKRMDLSNSKNLKATPCFEGIPSLEQLDLTGCINLSHVDPSIGQLTELVFLSLQRCTSLVSLDFGNKPRLKSLRVLCLSDCTKLENTPNFSGLSMLEYLDMDRCASLSMIHESIGALEKLRFLSLRDCTNLVGVPDTFYKMTSLITLDLCGCSKFTNLSLGEISTSPLQSLIYLDLSFCSISEVPDAIGKLKCLERLNLQGNNFTILPSNFHCLRNLSYLNLSHCHSLQSFPELPIESGPSDLVGRYFKTTSESRNQRSGLYIFDTLNCVDLLSFQTIPWFKVSIIISWVRRLVKEPLHFRCGFDIVLPWNGETIDHYANDFDSMFSILFPNQFKESSIVRINKPVMDVDWVGFLFNVKFELNNHNHQSLSSPLPHPFYLSFESEYTEERFDMPLNLESYMVDGSTYIWTIYISREHCHFVQTGAQITFKARPGLIIKGWGLHELTKKDIEDSEWTALENRDPKKDRFLLVIDNVEENNNNFEPKIQLPYNWLSSEDTKGSKMEMSVDHPLQIASLEESSSSSSISGSIFEPKIQLPYNWLVSYKDEAERDEAMGKESNLINNERSQ